MKLSKLAGIVLQCLTVMLFMGCNADEGKIDITSQHQHVEASVKASSPVVMSYQPLLKRNAEIGESYSFNVEITSRTNSNNLTVSILMQGDMDLMNADTIKTFGSQNPGQVNKFSVTVMPNSEGVFYIYISATTQTDNMPQTGNFAIPVYVGNQSGQFKSSVTGVVEDNEQGEKIIHMPAIETTN